MAEPVVFPQLVIPRNADYADEQGNISSYEGSVNCAAAVGAALANTYPQAKLVTHHAFRLAAGAPKDANGRPLGLGSSQVAAGLAKLGVAAKRYYGESFTTLRDFLAKPGAMAFVAVDYGFVNDHYPELSGQVTFRKGHAWLAYHFTANDPRLGGRNSVMIGEGLYDGRTRDQRKYPEGPQLAPFGAVRGAMGAFRVGGTTYLDGKPIGTDLGIFVTVPAFNAPEPTPPDPTDPDAATIAELEARISAKDGYFDAIIASATKGKEV
jgi:hypothetical protein